jgi:hypothetical protein
MAMAMVIMFERVQKEGVMVLILEFGGGGRVQIGAERRRAITNK